MKSNSKTVEINEFIFPLYRYAVLLVCYTLLRIAFYCFNVGLFPNVTFESFWTLLYGGVRFDLSALTYLNLLYLNGMNIHPNYQLFLYMDLALLNSSEHC